MKIYATYRLMTSVLSFAILLGMALPSGLNAKKLIDFCMSEMNHHEMMDDSHECCIKDGDDHSSTEKNRHNCDGIQICACTVDNASQRNQTWVPSSNSSAVILSQTGFNFSITSPDEIVHKDLFAAAKPYSPPLYLLHDTFLN